MAKVDYLLQGLTEDSHLNVMEDILSLPNIKKVIMSVAFMKKRGLMLLNNKLKPFYGATDVYVGIRNGVTSIQAILELLSD